MLKLREPGEREVLAAKMLTDEYIQRLAFLRVCVSLPGALCHPQRRQGMEIQWAKDVDSSCISLSFSYLLSLSPGPSPALSYSLLLKSEP